MSAPFVLAPGEQHPGAPAPGPRLPFIRITGGDTDGLFAMAEVEVPPLTAGPHLHVHNNEDEMFFVLFGMLTIQIGEGLHDIGMGGLAWGARGVPHAFANRSQEPLRIIILWVPAGAERLFGEMEAYRQTLDGSPAPEEVASIMARHGATRVGPQIPIRY